MGEIVPDRKLLGFSGCPDRYNLVTRLSSNRQSTPVQVQQSVPGTHDLSMPDGSDLIPDLKPNRPASSPAWHLAPLTLLRCSSRVEEMVRRMRRVVVVVKEEWERKRFIFCLFLSRNLRMGEIKR